MMSLVAPIQMDQYIQYANRTANEKHDYASISKISKVQLNSEQLKRERKEDSSKFSNILASMKRKQEKNLPPDITGKGFIIHETV